MTVLDFAMETERRGRDFYRRLAQKVEEEGLKTIYGWMAEDEERILHTFQVLAERLPATDSRALEGMKDLFKEKLNEEEALRLSSEPEAYLYLMKVEKDLCRMYEEAAERETNPAAREQLLTVAAEEERELMQLESIYDFVNAPNEYLAWREFSNLDEFHNFGRFEDNRECRHTAA